MSILHLFIRVSLTLLLLCLRIMIRVLISLSLLPIAHIHHFIPVLVYPEALLLVLHKLTIVNVVLWLPLQPQSVLAALVQVLSLPAAQVSLAVEVPNQADVSRDHHRAVCVSLYYEVLVRDLELREDRPGCLI